MAHCIDIERGPVRDLGLILERGISNQFLFIRQRPDLMSGLLEWRPAMMRIHELVIIPTEKEEKLAKNCWDKNPILKIKSSQQSKQDEVSRALWVSKRSHTSHIARSRRLEILLECVKIWSKPLTIEAQGSHRDIQGQWSKCGWMQKAWNYQSQSNSIILFYVSWNINEWILGCSRSGCPLILSQVIFIFIFRKGL